MGSIKIIACGLLRMEIIETIRHHLFHTTIPKLRLPFKVIVTFHPHDEVAPTITILIYLHLRHYPLLYIHGICHNAVIARLGSIRHPVRTCPRIHPSTPHKGKVGFTYRCINLLGATEVDINQAIASILAWIRQSIASRRSESSIINGVIRISGQRIGNHLSVSRKTCQI